MGRRELIPILEDLRGKLSKIVFSKNLAGPYFRRYVIPQNPRSDKQIEVRATISEASKDWQSLTQEQQEFWKGYINSYKDWYIGEAEHLSGFQVFMSVTSQIKQAIKVGTHTEIINTGDWEQSSITYNKQVQPGTKPPLVLKNIGNYSYIVEFYVSQGIAKVRLTVNLENNSMQNNDYLKSANDKRVSFVIWASNPGKYITSNMKPMTLKVLHSNLLKIKKEGSQVSTIILVGTLGPAGSYLTPVTGNYIRYTLGLQSEDGPYTIIAEDITRVN